MRRLRQLILGWAILLQSFNVQAQGFPSFADLVEKLQPSVVNISTTRREAAEGDEMPGIESTNPRIKDYFNPQNPQQLSLGSGFIIDKNGYIITNNHVIDQAEEITVTLADNRQAEAKVIGRDGKTDIALIKINMAEELPAVKLGDSDKIRVGDWVLAIGNPFGLGGSVSAGIVSAKSRDIESGPYDSFIQTDASINQGSSGGPMFNPDGEVIGINTAIFSTNGGSMGIGFAVPINLTHFVIEQLKSKGKVERGWIGIKIQPNSGDIAASLRRPDKKGVIVSAVTENSSAKAAGVEAGDIILSFDGQPIDDTKNFSRMVAESNIGSKIQLEIWRNNTLIKVEPEVLPMPEERKQSAAVKDPGEAETALIEWQPTEITELGIEAAELSPETRNRYHLGNEAQGVVITAVAAGSDAELKGLAPGGLIIQMDKKTIVDMDDVRAGINDAKLENSRPVLLLVNDNNVPHYVAVKLKNNE